MPLPLAALTIHAGARILGSHALRATVTDAAFNLGGKATGKLLPSLGKEAGIGDSYAPSLSTYGKVSAAAIDNFSMGKLIGKTDVIKDIARDAVIEASSANIPGIGKALHAVGLIERACDSFSSAPSALKLFEAAKRIDFDSIASASRLGGAAGALGGVLAGFSDLLQSVSKLTGQVLDHLPETGGPRGVPSGQPKPDSDEKYDRSP